MGVRWGRRGRGGEAALKLPAQGAGAAPWRSCIRELRGNGGVPTSAGGAAGIRGGYWLHTHTCVEAAGTQRAESLPAPQPPPAGAYETQNRFCHPVLVAGLGYAPHSAVHAAAGCLPLGLAGPSAGGWAKSRRSCVGAAGAGPSPQGAGTRRATGSGTVGGWVRPWRSCAEAADADPFRQCMENQRATRSGTVGRWRLGTMDAAVGWRGASCHGLSQPRLGGLLQPLVRAPPMRQCWPSMLALGPLCVSVFVYVCVSAMELDQLQFQPAPSCYVAGFNGIKHRY
eukprot:scaffold15065_cov19-Tisochrysis_lutea.AAC.2